eukprot:scaffold4188_cov115-Isochrysis_galbana.AAC.3
MTNLRAVRLTGCYSRASGAAAASTTRATASRGDVSLIRFHFICLGSLLGRQPHAVALLSHPLQAVLQGDPVGSLHQAL